MSKRRFQVSEKEIVKSEIDLAVSVDDGIIVIIVIVVVSIVSVVSLRRCKITV